MGITERISLRLRVLSHILSASFRQDALGMFQHSLAFTILFHAGRPQLLNGDVERDKLNEVMKKLNYGHNMDHLGNSYWYSLSESNNTVTFMLNENDIPVIVQVDNQQDPEHIVNLYSNTWG